MNKFPPKYVMILSILIMAILTGLRYSKKYSPQMFQLKFDWEKEFVIQEFTQLKLDSLSYNFLKFEGIPDGFHPNNQNTYSLTLEKGEKYYFRYINSEKHNEYRKFYGVEWITGVPDLPTSKVKLTESKIPLHIQNGLDVVCLGDESLVKDEAKYFRRKIASKSDFNFLGRQTDVFNYAHEAAFHRNWTSLLDEIPSIPDAQIYIVFGSITQEEFAEPKLKTTLNSILSELSKKKDIQKIIWIQAPFVKDSTQNEINRKFNEALAKLNNPKLEIINAYQFFENEKQDYLMPDKVNLNKYGYEELAKQTLELLK